MLLNLLERIVVSFAIFQIFYGQDDLDNLAEGD